MFSGRQLPFRAWVGAAVVLAAITATRATGASSGAPPSVQLSTFGKLPISFEPNVGQADPRVRFLARGAGYKLYLTRDSAVLALAGASSRPRGKTVPPPALGRPSATLRGSRRMRGGRSGEVGSSLRTASLRIRLLNASRSAPTKGGAALPGKADYLVGSDRSKWHAGVSTYASVRQENVYPGIDLVYYGNQTGRLEHDFVVRPGADPSRIRLSYTGADRARVDEHGDLRLLTTAGEVVQRKPVVYQELNGKRQAVTAAYELSRSTVSPSQRSGARADYRVSFRLGHYDRQRPLVIDPVLAYSTFLGGSNGSVAFSIAVDANGCAYITGQNFSSDFPVTAGPFQAPGFASNQGNVFVTKLALNGQSVVYSTYFGGSVADSGNGIAVDKSGSAYVTGQTSSPDFPTTPGALLTVNRAAANGAGSPFVTKLAPNGGSIAYSTFLGGSSDDNCAGIAVDSAGCAYVTGQCSSIDFPTTAGAFQTAAKGFDNAFVSKLTADGSGLVYSTYLSGSSADLGNAIAVDSAGCAYVTGQASSADFPITAGAFQTRNAGAPNQGSNAFVTKLATDGRSLLYSTFVGGSFNDLGSGIAVDTAGAAYITGIAYSPDFPTTPGAFQLLNLAALNAGASAFITKVAPNGQALAFSTYLGGSFFDCGGGIAVDSAGSAYVVGQAFSSDFPTLAGALQLTSNSSTANAFVTKATTTGTIVYSTYIGGSNFDLGYAIAVDANGSAYIAGDAGSADFPITSGAFQTTSAAAASGGNVGFVVKFGPLQPIAVDDAYNAIRSSTLTVSAANGVLANDSDPFQRSLSVSLVSGPSYGTLSLSSNGSFTYTPGATNPGTDSFTYRSFDGVLYSNPATVTISVLGTISGTTFTDANGSKVATGQPALAGVTITLTGPGGTQTTTSASNGTYSFTGLPAGSYTVSAPTTAFGETLDTSATLAISLSAGGSSANNNFGYVAAQGSIAGSVYADTNGSQALESGEPGIVGVTVALSGPGGTKTAITGLNGTYSFGGLAPGRYTVSAPANAAGLVRDTPSPVTISLAAATDSKNNNFGYAVANSCSHYTTYTQGGWGGSSCHGSVPTQLLAAGWPKVYSGGLVLGRGGYTLTLSSTTAVHNFLPQGGSPGQFTRSYVNVTSTSAGVLAGQLVSAKINVDFSAAGFLPNTVNGTFRPLGTLIYHGSSSRDPFNGQTVNQILTWAYAYISKSSGAKPGPGTATVSDLNNALNNINQNYDDGSANMGFLRLN